jgi:hypothetical protein
VIAFQWTALFGDLQLRRAPEACGSRYHMFMSMVFDSIRLTMTLKRNLLITLFALCAAVSWPISSIAAPTTWTFKAESVDASARFSSIAVDAQGNVHLAYTIEGDHVKYAFRDSTTGKWFKTDVDAQASFTSLALDAQGNPHICYTQRIMRYAYWNGHVWQKEEVSPGAGTIAYYCSVAISADEAQTPHVTWYQERTPQDTNYLHMRHAVLQDGQWVAKTIDWDAQTGKWHTMVLDRQGRPHVSFDAYVSGQLKYATWDNDHWVVVPVDSRTSSQQPGRGMGNCLVLTPQGLAMISYFEEGALKFARQKEDGRWSVETLASTTPSPSWAGYRSVLALDSKGQPHIVYEDAGTLRHMYWDGANWQAQLIAPTGRLRLRYGSIAISHDDTIFISYSDPEDGSLKVAVGHPTNSPANIADKNPNH